MKGTVGFDKKAGRYFVTWYDKNTRRTEKLWHYNGDTTRPFISAINAKGEDEGRILAQRMLDQMRGDEERGVFLLSKFKFANGDIIKYLQSWLEATKGSISPGTYLRRRSAIKNWLIPFFESRNIMLHEIQYDTLFELAGFIKGTGEYRQSILHILHACLRFARRSNRIQTMPEFPETKTYGIIQKRPEWIPEERVDRIIGHIPIEDQPIFWYLKLHLRRPGEVCVLKKADLQGGVFLIQRGVSGYREIDTPKDKAHHRTPIHSEMVPWLEAEHRKQAENGIVSPYVFVNLRAKRKNGKRYAIEYLEKLWNKAASECGETIDLYRGTKTSRASSLINEHGLSLSELQMAGDWKTLAAVKKYGDVTDETRKNLLEGKKNVIEMKEKTGR